MNHYKLLCAIKEGKECYESIKQSDLIQKSVGQAEIQRTIERKSMKDRTIMSHCRKEVDTLRNWMKPPGKGGLRRVW